MKKHLNYLLVYLLALVAILSPTLSRPHPAAHAQDENAPYAFGVEWSPDGKWIAVPSTDGLWMFNAEIVERAPIQYFAGSVVPAVAFDPRRDRMAVYDEAARQIHIIEPATGEIITDIPGATGEYDFAYDLEYNLDGTLLMVGYDSSLKIYDAMTNHERQSYDSNPVFSIAPTPDSDIVVAGDFLGSLKTYDVNKADAAQSVFAPDELTEYPVIYQVGLLPDSTEGVAIRWTGLLRFDLEDESSALFDPELTEDVRCFALNHAGDTLAIGTDNGIVVYDLTTNAITHTITPDEKGIIVSLAFNPDDSKLVTLNSEGTIQIFWEFPDEGSTVTMFNNFTGAYRSSWG